MSYATTTELADYLGVEESELPDDADRLLDRASEVIDYITLDRIDESITEQADAAKKATMAQYEWWAEIGDELGYLSQINSISIGEFSLEGGASQKSIKQIAPRAVQSLFLAGLLYRGVNSR